MSTATVAAPASVTSTTAAKKARELYGKTGKPIRATKVWHMDMSNFPDPDTKAECWVIENATDGTIVFANTYNGQLGKDWDPAHYTHIAANLDSKKHAKRIKKYKEVSIDQCPVAEAVETA